MYIQQLKNAASQYQMESLNLDVQGMSIKTVNSYATMAINESDKNM